MINGPRLEGAPVKPKVGHDVEELGAQLEQARREAAHWERAATRNGELYAAAEKQRDVAREALAQVRDRVAGESGELAGSISSLLEDAGYTSTPTA